MRRSANPAGHVNSDSVFGKHKGPNKRSVWTVAMAPYAEAHFATYPPALIEPCTLAGGPEGGTVLDPFLGAGTTALVADRLGGHCLGIELSPVMRSSRAAGSAVRPSPRPRSGGKGLF